MDFNDYNQLYAADLFFNPPQQLVHSSGLVLDTFGDIGYQGESWRIPYTLQPGYQHPSGVENIYAFLQPTSAHHISAGAVPFSQSILGPSSNCDVIAWQSTHPPVSSGMGGLYPTSLPFYDGRALIGQDAGIPVQAGIGAFDSNSWLFAAPSAGHSQFSQEGISMDPQSTLPQPTPQAGWEWTETRHGDFNNFEIMHDTFQQYQMPQKDAKHCIKKRMPIDMEREAKRCRIPGLKTSDGAAGVFSVASSHSFAKVSPTKSQQRRNKQACIRCKRIQRRCEEGPEESCTSCQESGHACIKEPKPFTNRDICIEEKMNFSHRPLFLSRTCDAQIFVWSPPNKSIVPLRCSVIFCHMGVNALWEKMSESWNWDSILSTGSDSVNWDLRVSCSIPTSHMPSHEAIQQWALESLETERQPGSGQSYSTSCIGQPRAWLADPSSSFGGLYDQLYLVATKYLECQERPLHNLVSLIRKYAAVYNICNSKLSMIVETRPHRPCDVNPQLRAQICVDVLRTLGGRLEMCLGEIQVTSASHTGESKLALSIILWFLLLMYRHSDARSRRMAFLHMEPEGISSEDLLETHQKLCKSLEYIRDLYGISFINPTGSTCLIFDKSFMPNQGDKTQNKELKNAVTSLRITMQQYVEDTPLTLEGTQPCIIKELIIALQKVRKQKSMKGSRDASARAPAGTANSQSKVDDLDFEKCSIVTGTLREKVIHEGEGSSVSTDFRMTTDDEEFEQELLPTSKEYAYLKFNMAFSRFRMIRDVQPSLPMEYLRIPELEETWKTSEEGQENEYKVLLALEDPTDSVFEQNNQ